MAWHNGLYEKQGGISNKFFMMEIYLVRWRHDAMCYCYIWYLLCISHWITSRQWRKRAKTCCGNSGSIKKDPFSFGCYAAPVSKRYEIGGAFCMSNLSLFINSIISSSSSSWILTLFSLHVQQQCIKIVNKVNEPE